MFHVGLVPYDVARRVGLEGPEFEVGQTRFLFAFLSLCRVVVVVVVVVLFCFFLLVFFLVIAVLVCFFI